MSEQHIVSAYDRDLETIQALIFKMSGLVEDAIGRSIEALSTRDVELAEQIRAADKQIDALEEKINDEAARTIALRAPVSKDLRIILSVLRISSSLERIGDYAKNIAKRVTVLAEQRAITESDATLRRMAREVERMLKDTLDAFVQRDATLAQEIIGRDTEIDQMYNALFREFFTHMLEDPRNITACMHLHFVAKNLERMGDIVTNIAEQVIYVTTGNRPEEPRTKEDETPFIGKVD
ncbi:phosphate signaling complex protein PhoU [Ketogulonicigenium vulgare]|uniref:Phosphate-specific transport system accessory protein PhoU n=1 Tax=Ketogulonicigenium vulgare (strain WSH-001) TaxID=759362 RepID=F9Y9M9_KETVW|nr:phosphate signaling complex protein PhoU [Ketogulonicigenium vulgare]ADO41344.1 phosphate transport system regulatory protein PhoU [Ketogulonicigenium vulgare Y25]AEM41367.1 Phosphate transport system regulatory protein PhoU [Ketogulonicigenium vulgare WSH-001]ALJ81506.1 PhoU family transcriptional regulator [Ketogulonicigenium vulgare]ANW34214.1 phosphate transport system regulatory protein PhoU [Ketogulonicigenium vulgare]AOZ55112.1 phosphate transporter regulatory protein PhoU [Ketogulon